MTSLSLVGHSADLDELACTWSERDPARSRTVVITGAAGVGKSRLVAAALETFEPAPTTVLTGAARLHSPAPYDWLASVLDWAGTTPSADLPAPPDALAWLAQEPDVPRERYAPDALLRIAVRVVRALVAAGPAVLVAEDLHALDPASLNLLAALAGTPDIPALLLVTSRPPTADDTGRLVARTLARLTGAPSAVRVHLRPWSRAEVADALGQVYPDHLVTGAVVDAAVRRSGGNPYLVTELLADLGGRDPVTLTSRRRAARRAQRSEGDGPGAKALTARERDVLGCLASGMANKQIARSLGISVRTVAVHVSNLLRKTGTASRTDAALWAVRHDVDTMPGEAAAADPTQLTADEPEATHPVYDGRLPAKVS